VLAVQLKELQSLVQETQPFVVRETHDGPGDPMVNHKEPHEHEVLYAPVAARRKPLD
jgi:hypothetical protein